MRKSYWNISHKYIDGKQLFTATLNPHAHDCFLVFPKGCDGVHHSGVYWYKDVRLAKAATYFNYLQELMSKKKLKDMRHTLDDTVLF